MSSLRSGLYVRKGSLSLRRRMLVRVHNKGWYSGPAQSEKKEQCR